MNNQPTIQDWLNGDVVGINDVDSHTLREYMPSMIGDNKYYWVGRRGVHCASNDKEDYRDRPTVLLSTLLAQEKPEEVEPKFGEWISVEDDGQPKKGGNFNVCLAQSREVIPAYFAFSSKLWFSIKKGTKVKVSDWMPLPEAPKTK